MSKGLPSPKKMKNQEIPRSTDLAEAKRLLAKIEPEDYNVWFEVGCALKGMGADYKMFCDWSARSEKFDADECREKWDQLPDEPRAGLTTLRNLADGVDVCRAKAEATGKKKDRIVSSTSDTVPHTQPINQSTEGACAVTATVPSVFLPPPEEMLPPPSSGTEQIRQAAWLITRLFSPGEKFEFCGSRECKGRVIPDRGSTYGRETTDTEDSLCNDEDLKALIREVVEGVYISMNPIRPLDDSQKASTDSSVTDYRVALIECDGVPIAEQWEKLAAMRLPVIAITHSGSKSLHCLCRIDAGNDQKLYQERVAKLYEYAYAHGLPLDPACKNPSRLTRCPGFRRGEKMQYLVSKSWGYPSWDAFAANELQGNPTSPTDQPKNSDANQAGISDALTAKYGPAVEFTQSGKPRKLNQCYFAAYVMQSYKLQYSQGYLWEYDEKKGLWQKMSDARFRSKTAEAIRNYGKQNNMDLSMLCDAKTCDHVKAFIHSSNATDPFSHRGKKFIHVANGVLEIGDNGEVVLKPFSPDYYSRNRCEIAYDEHAQCPRFLHELLEPALSQEDIELLQMYCGQCLLGDNFTQKVLLLTGIGGTGKGVIVNIIRGIVGSENCSELRTRHTMERFETANYIGKTLLLGADVSPTFLQERGSTYIKALTGNDTLTAEIKGERGGISFQGNFNIIVTSNSRLRIRVMGDQSAWIRRLIYIEFERPGTETPIPNFADILLKEEGPGILLWMIRGLQKLLRAGYPQNSSSDRRVDNLLRESDSVMGFIRARLRRCKEPHSDITFDRLYEKYTRWCLDHDWDPLVKQRARSHFVDGIMCALRVGESHDLKIGLVTTRGWHGLIVLDKDSEDDDTDSTNTSSANN